MEGYIIGQKKERIPYHCEPYERVYAEDLSGAYKIYRAKHAGITPCVVGYEDDDIGWYIEKSFYCDTDKILNDLYLKEILC